ncbi:hypothetical protein HYC85_028713 [Camellia sinensis]|uniref:Uncharacterized protein n=1 Tax=Camellia sinensis TaxID=4442 RepID=A0A7J7FW22_CAMSI|nr:hypothetical protein HYC85_028713 [Camellia sinensis]
MDNIAIFGHVQFLQERNANIVICDERDLNAKEKEIAKALLNKNEKITAHNNNVISKVALAQRARRERERNDKASSTHQLGQRLRRERERSRELIPLSTTNTSLAQKRSNVCKYYFAKHIFSFTKELVNAFVAKFHQAHAILNQLALTGRNLPTHLHYNSSTDQRRYNLPTTDEIAVVIPGDGTKIEKMNQCFLKLSSVVWYMDHVVLEIYKYHVWKLKKRWKLRQQGYAIGRILGPILKKLLNFHQQYTNAKI